MPRQIYFNSKYKLNQIVKYITDFLRAAVDTFFFLFLRTRFSALQNLPALIRRREALAISRYPPHAVLK